MDGLSRREFNTHFWQAVKGLTFAGLLGSSRGTNNPAEAPSPPVNLTGVKHEILTQEKSIPTEKEITEAIRWWGDVEYSYKREGDLMVCICEFRDSSEASMENVRRLTFNIDLSGLVSDADIQLNIPGIGSGGRFGKLGRIERELMSVDPPIDFDYLTLASNIGVSYEEEGSDLAREFQNIGLVTVGTIKLLQEMFPNRKINLGGYSAGANAGLLAAILSTDQQNISLTLVNGIYELTLAQNVSDYLLKVRHSPSWLLQKDFSPQSLRIYHALQDELVPVSQSQFLKHRLDSLRVQSTLFTFEGGHLQMFLRKDDDASNSNGY